jgi:hypothetical protein
MKKSKTCRGFNLIEFKDIYGDDCSIQKSSLATTDAIWLGITDVKPIVMASQAFQVGISTDKTTGWVDYPIPEEVQLASRMHLDKKLAKKLIKVLKKFVDTGDIY